MKIENQVISLESAIKLKELGVKQDSLFYWADNNIVTSVDMDLLIDGGKTRSQSGAYNNWPDQERLNICSAFTVSELSNMLPFGMLFEKHENGYFIGCSSYRLYISNKTLSDTLAQMFMLLIENNLWKPE